MTEVMHFNPDGITDDQRLTLRRVASFMTELHELEIIG
jgi:hypothetical protein